MGVLEGLLANQKTPQVMDPGQGGIMGALKGMGSQIDPMTLMSLGSNILAAQGQPSPTPIGAMGRLGMGIQNAIPQMAQLQTLKQRRALMDEERGSRKEIRQMAQDALKTIDVNQDGVISPQERQRADMLKLAVTTSDPKYLSEAAGLLAPAEEKPLSPVGKLRQDLMNGIITEEQFQAELAARGKPGVSVNLPADIPKPPSGYYYTGDPQQGDYNLSPLPGGPADRPATEGAAKETMLGVAAEQLPELESYIFNEDGTMNRRNVGAMTAVEGGVPLSSGRKPASQMEIGIQAITRAETGAAMPPEEVRNTRRRFQPSLLDTDESAQAKMAMYADFLNGNLKLLEVGRTGEPEFNEAAFNAELEKRMNDSPNVDAILDKYLGDS